MRRRRFLVLAASIVVLRVPRSFGQVPVVGRIALLKELVEAIGAAGDSLKMLVDGLKHLVVTGASGYDAAKARLVHGRLVETSALATSLVASQMMMAQSLQDYVRLAPKSDEFLRQRAWELLVDRMRHVLERVLELLGRVREDRSDFVLEPAYNKLVQALTARSALLQRLLSIPPPTSPDELALVREAANRYAVLIRELVNARDEMNTYLKATKQ